MSRIAERPAQTWSSSTLHVIDDGVLGLRTSDILRKMQSGVGRPDPTDSGFSQHARELTLGSADGHAVGGLRTYLPEQIGDGYWDFIEVCPGLFLSITDATYRTRHRMFLPAESLVKIRVVCSGTLNMSNQRLSMTDGSVLIQRIGGDAPVEYLIEPGTAPLRMVVIHALPEALQNLGVTNEMLPEKLRSFLDTENTDDSFFSVEPSAKLIRIAKDILDSRDRLVNEMRQSYVRGKAYELLCEIILRTNPATDKRSGGNRFRQSDIVRLHEAKRILASDLELSPTIDQLSRLVGINRTKLKAGFREVFSETVQEYRMRVRMAEALRLIEETELSMAEIGRRVGFNHPANFTKVVKHRFGARPLELRKMGSAAVGGINDKG